MSTQTEAAELTAQWERWRAARLAAVNGPDGPPTLVATYWLNDPEGIPAAAGRWTLRGDQVILTTPELGPITVAPGEKAVLDGVTVQLTARLGRLGVRMFDHARAGSIDEIDAFEPSPEWVLEGRFAPLPPEATESYGHALESQPRELAVPGTVSFTLAGRDYETRPLGDADGSLLLVFADETTGRTSKPPGRFLAIAPPDESGAVTLDFNRAYLPPCAFSDEFNCPLPPPGHRFAAAVTAGETWPRRAGDPGER
jgi:uncharacterized protein (DUF1684 family)